MLETADPICQGTFGLACCEQNSFATGARRPARWRLTREMRLHSPSIWRAKAVSGERPWLAVCVWGDMSGEFEPSWQLGGHARQHAQGPVRNNAGVVVGVVPRRKVPLRPPARDSWLKVARSAREPSTDTQQKFRSRKDFPLGSLRHLDAKRDSGEALETRSSDGIVCGSPKRKGLVSRAAFGNSRPATGRHTNKDVSRQ